MWGRKRKDAEVSDRFDAAVAATRQSEQALQEAVHLIHTASWLSRRLSDLNEDNHFAEKMRIAYGSER